MTLTEEIKAIQKRLNETHDRQIQEQDGPGKLTRSENDAQWEVLELIAARIDALG